jgi:3-dehydroquinate synthase
MNSIKLPLGERSYEIHIGSGAVRKMPRLLAKNPKMASKRAFIIADERLKKARAEVVSVLKKSGWVVEEIAVRAGEPLKDIDAVFPIYGELLKRKADRNAVLFALGGGSVGDAAGFIASTYLRGIPWVGIPTTLLAQVDSSVGGKTAINHPTGKNLIGTTYQPSLVICDTDFLKTLSQREMISGLGEVAKYGIIYDPKFLSYLEKNWFSFLEYDTQVMAAAIQRSLFWKCRVVAKDEHDRKGIREALNFGHTFGHALEAATSFRQYQHGEAVIIGMRFALALSEVRGKLSSTERMELDSFLLELQVPPIPKKIKPSAIFALMKKDKKSESGKVRFVLISKAGRTVSDREVTPRDLDAAYRLMQGVRKGGSR